MSGENGAKPRIGVTFRTTKEQLAGDRAKIERYLKAVQLGGAEAVEVPLDLAPDDLRRLAATLDGVALSGSPADVDPALFHAPAHVKAAAPDQNRERTDFGLLEHCFAEQKPVLAICYGIQSLNVFLAGTLVQDIPSEIASDIRHDRKGNRAPEAFHTVQIEPGSRIAELAHGSGAACVNSSHHQSVLRPGRGIRVTARTADGVVEAVEGTSGAHWVTGVQWHPERMVETDLLARALFQDLAAAARKATVRA